MKHLQIASTPMVLWRDLIVEAEEARSRPLSEDLQSYLVFLLMRFMTEPQCVTRVVGLEFLESHHLTGTAYVERLQSVGDNCLIFSGLFPEIAAKRRVSLSYFIRLGQSAYAGLSDPHVTRMAALYAACRTGFLSMMDILNAVRELNTHIPLVGACDAADISVSVPDPEADLFLKRYTHSPIVYPASLKHKQ